MRRKLHIVLILGLISQGQKEIIGKPMKPHSILITIILFLAMFCSGAVNAQKLVIWQKDGSRVSYELDDQPKTTFTSDELVITTKTASISFPLAKIQRYTYESDELGVRDTKIKGISISHNNDVIVVKGLSKGKSVTVYSVDGIQQLAKNSDGSERLTISISTLTKGVYLIKADEITYKFSKR